MCVFSDGDMPSEWFALKLRLSDYNECVGVKCRGLLQGKLGKNDCAAVNHSGAES